MVGIYNWGLEFELQSLGFRVYCLELITEDLELIIRCLEFSV